MLNPVVTVFHQITHLVQILFQSVLFLAAVRAVEHLFKFLNEFFDHCSTLLSLPTFQMKPLRVASCLLQLRLGHW